MRDQLLPERLALLGIADRRFVGGAGHADRLCRDADATPFEIGECNFVPLALGAEHQVGGQFEVSNTSCAVSEARCPSFFSSRATR